MKPLVVRHRILVGMLVLAVAQLACSLGASPVKANAERTPSAGALATRPAGSASVVHGTLDQAMTMLKEAVAHYDTVGRTQALADFNGRVAPFFQGDLYVACIDSRLTISANGGFPNLVGSSVEPLSRAAWDAASTTKVSSTSYAYTDPVTKKTEPKTFYYEKVGSDVCGVGVYHP